MTSGRYGPRFPEGSGAEPHPLEAVALWVLGALILLGALVWLPVSSPAGSSAGPGRT